MLQRWGCYSIHTIPKYWYLNENKNASNGSANIEKGLICSKDINSIMNRCPCIYIKVKSENSSAMLNSKLEIL
jgi:hypothetical protein